MVIVLPFTVTSSSFHMPAGPLAGLCCALSAVVIIKIAESFFVNFRADIN
jgi:hypothetical protein